MWSSAIFCLVMVPQTLSLGIVITTEAYAYSADYIELLEVFAYMLKMFVTLTDGNADSKIIGGQLANIKDYPYQVYLRFPIIDSFCGGVIIGSSYILTAAHCIVGIITRPYTKSVEVRAGSDSKLKGGTIITIADIKSHPDFRLTYPPLENDVTCMKTTKPIEFSETIKAISLPAENRNVTGNAIVTGWGTTKYNSSDYPEELMVVTIPVVSQKDCKGVYGQSISDNMWCGGNFEDGGIGPCSGDSGGAAMQDNILIGIVSSGGVCGEPRQPAVFTYIASPSVRNFIKKYSGI